MALDYVSYAVHAAGTSHVGAGRPCQDSYKVARGDGLTVAAVADGLGSCGHSQVASAKAVGSLCEFILAEAPADPSPQVMSALMVAAFNHSLKAVSDELSAKGIDLDDAHTTLTAVAIFDGGFVWGHSGDGVVVALEPDGSYKVVCEPDKAGDKPNVTYPFTLGWKVWHVGYYDHAPASLLLATDGVGDVIYPLYMRGAGEVVIEQAAFFMNPSVIGIGEGFTDEDAAELSKSTLEAIRVPSNRTWSSVSDDITAVVLLDPAARPPVAEAQSQEYLQHLYDVFYDLADPEPARAAPEAGVVGHGPGAAAPAADGPSGPEGPSREPAKEKRAKKSSKWRRWRSKGKKAGSAPEDGGS